MTEHDSIRLTAEGMVRNFGNHAADQAETIATRYLTQSDKEAGNLWLAVAKEIRARLVQN